MALLTPPPAAPQRGDRATFAQRMDVFITWLINFVAELLALVGNLNSIAIGGAYTLNYVAAPVGSIGGSSGGRMTFYPNAISQAGATSLYLDTKDTTGVAVGAFLDSIVAGNTAAIKAAVKITKVGDPSKFIVFNVLAVTNATGYKVLTVQCILYSPVDTPFANNDSLILQFTPTAPAPVQTEAKFSEKFGTGIAGNGGAGSGAGVAANRPLNTTEYNSISGASLSNGTISLPAGTYRFSGQAPGCNVGGHRLYLTNTTDNISFGGSNAYSGTSGGDQTNSFISGEFTITATKAFQLRHYTSAASGAGAFGVALNKAGDSEVYAEITFTKVS